MNERKGRQRKVGARNNRLMDDEWMDGWMERGVIGWISEWIEEHMYVRLDGWMDR